MRLTHAVDLSANGEHAIVVEDLCSAEAQAVHDQVALLAWDLIGSLKIHVVM